MALVIKATNKYNQSITITQNANFQLVAVAGLTPPKANINTAELAVMDGSAFNSSKLNNRNIVLTIQPTGNVEAGRLTLYQYFKVKQPITLEIKTSSREVVIAGYIENMEIDLNANPQTVQVSIICPDPWFKAKTAQVIALNTNPKTIASESDDEVGAIFTATMSGAVSNPVFTDSTTGQSFGLTYDFVSGDVLTLNTRRGEKAVSVLRSGTKTNLLNYITATSKWIALATGDNSIGYSATSGAANMAVTVTLQSIFEGV